MATTSISLIREHTEKIAPPRALWVPFELGRPLGAPNDAAFQSRVLRAALALLGQPAPVLADYGEDAPAGHGAEEPWACLLPLPAAPEFTAPLEALQWELAREIALLQPWHDEHRRRGNRTTVGPGGYTPETIPGAAAALAAIALGEPPVLLEPTPASMPYYTRLIADDLKAFYSEAALAQPGAPLPSSQELGDWLYYRTALGRTLYTARDRLAASEDAREQGVARQIVPGRWNRRPETS